MTTYNILPTQAEFENMICEPYFDTEEIKLQKTIAQQVGFSSWEDYLTFMFKKLCNVLDLQALFKDFEQIKTKDSQLSSINFTSLFTKHFKGFDSMKGSFDEAAFQALEEDKKDKVGRFEAQMVRVYFHPILHRAFSDSSTYESKKALLIDCFNQFILAMPKVYEARHEIFTAIEGYNMERTRSVVEAESNLNYYFPAKAHLLDSLHKELKELNYIKENKDFKLTFKSRSLSNDLKRTLWLVDRTKAYYLLYRLNDRKEHIHGDRIDVIATRFFSFKKPISKSGGHSNYSKAFNQFENNVYLNKKMNALLNLLNSLGLS